MLDDNRRAKAAKSRSRSIAKKAFVDAFGSLSGVARMVKALTGEMQRPKTNAFYFGAELSRSERPHILWKNGKPEYLFLANHGSNDAGFYLKVGDWADDCGEMDDHNGAFEHSLPE